MIFNNNVQCQFLLRKKNRKYSDPLYNALASEAGLYGEIFCASPLFRKGKKIIGSKSKTPNSSGQKCK